MVEQQLFVAFREEPEEARMWEEQTLDMVTFHVIKIYIIDPTKADT
jgi:hypothetical protein